jgi:TonB family protein
LENKYLILLNNKVYAFLDATSKTHKHLKNMKNLAIVLTFLMLSNSLNAQRWSTAFVGKPSERAVYASNVAKAIQNAWESEIASKDKKEMLLDEIIFGQETEKKTISENKENITSVSNIDEISEVLGIKEIAIDPVKKKKVDTIPIIPPVKIEEKPTVSLIERVDEVKTVLKIQDIEESNISINKDKKSSLSIKLDDAEADSVYALPQVPAMYPGGPNAMRTFFFANIKTPESTGQSVKGKVFIRFMVKKNGELAKIYLVKGLTDTCNQEAMRVVKKMPKWLPATQEGEEVSSWHTLPIYFEIE